MSLTNDKEKALIKEKCKEIAKQRNESIVINNRNSYFVSGNELELFHLNDIRTYDVENMMDIKKEFENTFNRRNEKDMGELQTICAIAAMKNRSCDGNNRLEVSEFIYEF